MSVFKVAELYPSPAPSWMPAGKSSVLAALLGELQPTRSAHCAPSAAPVSVRGAVAYCSQVPWIVGGSLRENVLFGRQYEAERYAAVLKACALEGELAGTLDLAFCWLMLGRESACAHSAHLQLLGGAFVPRPVTHAAFDRPACLPGSPQTTLLCFPPATKRSWGSEASTCRASLVKKGSGTDSCWDRVLLASCRRHLACIACLDFCCPLLLLSQVARRRGWRWRAPHTLKLKSRFVGSCMVAVEGRAGWQGAPLRPWLPPGLGHDCDVGTTSRAAPTTTAVAGRICAALPFPQLR